METAIILLKKSLLTQAKFFLDEAGEFYPFGAAIDRKDNIKAIGVYLENDHPDSEEVLAFLEKSINKGLLNGDYQIAAIGVDVCLPSDRNDDRRSALEIRIMKKGNDMIKTYVPYYEENNRYFFEDLS